jgi:hypothetical protein
MLSAFQKDIEKEYRLPRHVRLPTFRDSQPGSSMARSVHHFSPFFACLALWDHTVKPLPEHTGFSTFLCERGLSDMVMMDHCLFQQFSGEQELSLCTWVFPANQTSGLCSLEKKFGLCSTCCTQSGSSELKCLTAEEMPKL